jgi:uncharacterized membrane protein
LTSQSDDARDRRRVALVLRTGLVVATALLLIGLVAATLAGEDLSRPFRLRDLLAPTTFASWIIGAGVLGLAVTPAIRVLLLVALWISERDWRFVLVAMSVAASLAVATFL